MREGQLKELPFLFLLSSRPVCSALLRFLGNPPSPREAPCYWSHLCKTKSLSKNTLQTELIHSTLGPRKILTGSGNQRIHQLLKQSLKTRFLLASLRRTPKHGKGQQGWFVGLRRRGVGTSRESHLDLPSTSLCHNRRCAQRAGPRMSLVILLFSQLFAYCPETCAYLDGQPPRLLRLQSQASTTGTWAGQTHMEPHSLTDIYFHW